MQRRKAWRLYGEIWVVRLDEKMGDKETRDKEIAEGREVTIFDDSGMVKQLHLFIARLKSAEGATSL